MDLPIGKAYFEARISHVAGQQQLVIIARDITEAHEAAELIRQQAYFDSLTTIPNRLLSLERDEFEVYYQPKINLKDRKVVGAEAFLSVA